MVANQGQSRRRGLPIAPVWAGWWRAATDELRPAALAYVAVVAALALGLTLVALGRDPTPELGSVLRGGALAGCMALAWLFPLHLAAKTKLYVDTAVTIAAVLVLPPGLAMIVAASGTLLGHLLRPASRDWIQALFNAAQVTLLTLIGALFLAGAGWNPAQPSFERPWPLLVLPLAGAVMHLMSVGSVATVVALQTGTSIRDAARDALLEEPRVEAFAQVTLLATGVLAAMMAAAYPWGLALVAVPIGATYATLRHQVHLRQEADRARLSSDAGLLEAQRLARLGSWEWDAAADRLIWSDEARRILGIASNAAAFGHAGLLQAFDPADRGRVDTALQEARRDGTPFQVDCRLQLVDGTRRVAHLRGERRPDAAAAGPRIAGTIQDVTERRELETRVADIAERERIAAELADARRRLAASRQDEALRLARELHDGPVQDLLAISYQLAARRRAAGTDPAAGADPALEPIRLELLGVVRQLRGLIGELRPPGLAEFGLRAALEGYVSRLERQASGSPPAIVLDFDDIPDDLPPPLALTLFRVVQEALRNATRHAAARHVGVSLRREGEEVLLRIDDDGKGFRVPPHLGRFAASGHFGLVGIAEGVGHLGGTLTIDSAPTMGTTIGVRAPLAGPGAADG